MVQGWCRQGQEAVRTVPEEAIFGGWPALSLLLSHPMKKLRKEIEFIWPSTLSSVVVKRAGAALDPDVGLGNLLRDPHDLSISIDGVDYPLEHDKAASNAGKRAAKERQRRVLIKVLWSQAGGCLLLFAIWMLLEWRISQLRGAEALDVDEVIATQKSRLRRTARRQELPSTEGEGWGSIQLGWAEPSGGQWSSAKDLPTEEDEV